MAEVTDTGFVKKTQQEYAEELQQKFRDRISDTLIFNENTFVGNVTEIMADSLAELDEQVEQVYNQFDPDSAVGNALVQLSKISGTFRRTASKGVSLRQEVTASKAVTFSAGQLVAHVAGDTTNRWVNREEIVFDVAGTQEAIFDSEDVGAKFVAPQGTLIVIAAPIDGWTSTDNPYEDAVAGTDAETIEDLRARRNTSLAAQGSASVPGITSDVSDVNGVISTVVIENPTDDPLSSGQPGHSVRTVIWDGSPSAAIDTEVAQAVYDSKAAGINTFGATSANATDPKGNAVPINFDRATKIDIHVKIEVKAPDGADAADIRAAIVGRTPTAPGEDVIYEGLKPDVWSVSGVENILEFLVDTIDPPVASADIAIDDDEIGVIATSNVDVVVTP